MLHSDLFCRQRKQVLVERIHVKSTTDIDVLISQIVFNTFTSTEEYSSSSSSSHRLISHLLNQGFYFQLSFLPTTYNKWACMLLYDNSRAYVAQSDAPMIAVSIAALKAYGVEIVVDF